MLKNDTRAHLDIHHPIFRARLLANIVLTTSLSQGRIRGACVRLSICR
jgi:hypothetical protein